MPAATIIPQVWSQKLGNVLTMMGFLPEPEPQQSVEKWLLDLEMSATAAVTEGCSIEPFSVLDWLEDLRDDHAELR